MRKLNVMHIITKLELGGAQQNTLYSVANHDRSKYNIFLVSGPEGILVPDAKNIKDAEVILLPELKHAISLRWDWKCYNRLVNLLKEKKIDIVHTHSSKAGILGRYAARKAGVPAIIHTIHGFSFNDFQNPVKRNIFIGLEKAAAKFTDKLIAVTSADVDKGLNAGVGKTGQYTVIHSSIELDEFTKVYDTAEVKAEFGIKPGEKVAGMIACLKPQKNPLDFVRAAAEVLKEVPEAKFLLVGDGELKEEVEKAVSDLGIKDRFILAGWRRDVARVLSCFDVLVLTSLWEGLPRVFPQAMAERKPIVATLVDGAKEAVMDGVNGFIAQPRDYTTVAKKVVYLLKNPSEAKEMGEAGYKMSSGWDARKMVPAIEKVYEEVFNRKYKLF